MYIWHFCVDGGSVSDWLQLILTGVVVFYTVKYGKYAVRTLKHMKRDTKQTLDIFKTENRPYLAVLPRIRWFEDQADVIENGIKQKRTFTFVAYSIKNHGRLPATIKGLRVALTDQNGNARLYLEGGIAPREWKSMALFPDVEKEMETSGTDNFKSFQMDIGAVYGPLYFVSFWIKYSMDESSSEEYLYESLRRIRSDIEDDSAVLSEVYK